MPSIVTNFKFKSSAPNFERDQVKSVSQLKSAKRTDYDRGHIVYCVETNKHYSFGTDTELWKKDDVSNESYGYFSIFTTAGSGSGGSGSGGDKNGVYRTVFLFKTTKDADDPNTTPEKPVYNAWKWDNIQENVVCIAIDENGIKNNDGWTTDNTNMPNPVWMSIGSLNINFPAEISWTIPTRITGEHGTSYHYIYRKTKGQTAPLIPKTPTVGSEEWNEYQKNDNYLPKNLNDPNDIETTWWTTSMQGVDDEVRYEWMCYRIKTPNANGVLEWSEWIGDENGYAVLVNFYSEKEYTTMYYLNIDPLVIKEDKYGKKETNELSVNIYYKKGDEVKYVSAIPEGYRIECEGPGIEKQTLSPGSTNFKFNVATATGAVTVKLIATENGVDRIIDMETIPLLKDGDSNIIADLTNDSYSITCNNFGDPINDAEIASTEFKMYYGLDLRTIDSASVIFKAHEGTEIVEKTINLTKSTSIVENKYADFYVKASLSSTYVTLSISQVDEVALAGMDFLIAGKTTVNGKEMVGTATFNVRKVIPGGKTPTLYQMVPSASSITKSKPDPVTGDVTFLPASIGVQLIKIQGEGNDSKEEGKITTLQSIPSGMKIVVIKDGLTSDIFTAGMEPPTDIETYDINESLEFQLVNDSSVIHDIYIPLMKDGMDSTIYQLRPDVTTVRIYQDGTYSTSKITLAIHEIIGNNVRILNTIPSGMEMYVGYDHGTLSKTTSMTVNVNSATKMITVELRESGKIVDKLMIPVVSDGRDGETTTIYSINASVDVIRVSADGSTTIPSTISAGALKKAGQGIVSADDAVDIIAVANTGSARYYIKKDGSGISTTVFNGARNENFIMPANTVIPVSPAWTAIEFYIFKDDGTMVDHESIPILRDGVVGESALVANLTNDMLAIQCDQYGNVYDTANKTTTFELYYGTTKQSLSSLTAPAHSGLQTSCNKSTGVVTISSIGSMNSDSVLITITGTDMEGRSMSKDLKIVKIKKGDVGDDGESALSASLSSELITIQCDQNGNPTDTSNKTTTYSLYYGTEKQTLSSLTATVGSSGLQASCNKTTGVVTVSNIGSMAGDVAIITITGSCALGSMSKDLKVVKVKKGSDGRPGEKGAKLRMTTYSPYGPGGTASNKTYYLCGSQGEEFYDVVIYGDALYLCIKSHLGGTSAPAENQYWTKAAYWDFVATKLLLAEKIAAKYIDVEELTAAIIDTGLLVVDRLETSGNGSKIVIENGVMEVFNDTNKRNIQFGVDDKGYAVLKYFNNDGELLYNLGPDGINKLETYAASFSQARYLRLCGNYDPSAPYQNVMQGVNGGNQYYKTARDSFNSSEATYLYTSGRVLGVVQHPEYDEVCFRSNRVNSSTNLPLMENRLPDGIYCLSAASQAEANSTMVKYPQWNTAAGAPPMIHKYNEPIIVSGDQSIGAPNTPLYFAELYHFEGGRLEGSVTVYWNPDTTSGSGGATDGRL